MARLVFFGTPEFAVPSLEALLESPHHEVALVVCQPDRPKGRGRNLQAPPVKRRAQQAGIETAQPSTLKQGTPDGDAFFAQFTALAPDLAVVTAYGRILSRRLLSVPRHGFVNVHASLLPRWRGAAPIQRAIEAGDAQTGVCLMDMVYELDAGDVLASAQTPIVPSDTGDSLSERLAFLGKELLASQLDALVEGRLRGTPQPIEGVTYASMLRKEEGQIDWSLPAQQIFDHVRAMHAWPGSYTSMNEEVIKLFDPALEEGEGPAAAATQPGTVLANTPRLLVSTGRGLISFGMGQLPGKRRMAFAELVRGRAISPGTQLGGGAASADAPANHS